MPKRRADRGEARAWLLARVGADTDDCIDDWPFSVDENGYPRIRWGDKRQRPKAAAVMCELTHDPKPSPELEACHSCVPVNHMCLNGRHLRWDTHAANQADMGRDGSVSGTRNGKAKLSDDQVRELRVLHAEGWSLRSLDRRYGLRNGTSWYIVRKGWRHI